MPINLIQIYEMLLTVSPYYMKSISIYRQDTLAAKEQEGA